MKRLLLSSCSRGRSLGLCLLIISSLAASGVSAEDQTRLDYLLHCSGCHLPSGEGAHGVRGLNELGPIVARAGGRDYLVQVPDATQAPVSDAQLAAITNWVLRRFNEDSLPDDFVPLTADEVSRARTVVLLNPSRHRAEILKRPVLR